MKAAVYDRYGPPDVVRVRSVERPAIGPRDVLVQVYSTCVSTGDWRLRSMKTGAILQVVARLMFGIFRPRNRILGSAFAGRVVGIGGEVTNFQLDDEVMGVAKTGAHAEFVALREDQGIIIKPSGLGYDEAAAAPFGGLSAITFLRDMAGMKPGHKVLVTGASGGVGVFAVQVAKLWGAQVTALTSTGNTGLVASLGADRVIDYKRDDFTRDVTAKYDVIFDTAGVTSFGRVRHLLASDGVFVPLEFGVLEILQATFGKKTGRRVKIGIGGDDVTDLQVLADLLDAGAVRAVVDSEFSLEQIADAHRRVETRHKTGAVVVAVSEPPDPVPAGLPG